MYAHTHVCMHLYVHRCLPCLLWNPPEKLCCLVVCVWTRQQSARLFQSVSLQGEVKPCVCWVGVGVWCGVVGGVGWGGVGWGGVRVGVGVGV